LMGLRDSVEQLKEVGGSEVALRDEQMTRESV